MLRRLGHAPDAEQSEVAVAVGNAALLDPVDLAARDHEPVGELPRRHLDRDVLAQPAQGHSHLRTAPRRAGRSPRTSGYPGYRGAARRSGRGRAPTRTRTTPRGR